MIEHDAPQVGVFRFAVRARERWLGVSAVVNTLEQEVPLLHKLHLQLARRGREIDGDTEASVAVANAILGRGTVTTPQHERGQLVRGARPGSSDGAAHTARERN